MSYFSGVFDECRRIVFSNKFKGAVSEWLCRPPLDSLRNVEELLAFLSNRFNRACLEEIERQNTILYQLLSIHKENTGHVDLKPLFLLIFQPSLQKFLQTYSWADSGGSDLSQVIFISFIEVLNKYPLLRRPKKIALNIVLDTKHKVTDWVTQQNSESKTEILMEEVTGCEKEAVHASETEEALVTLIDLAHGFGHDEATDRLCARIDSLHKKGIINDAEKRILIGRLIYKEPLNEMVGREEYHKWRVRMQRLMPKINK